MTDHFSGTSFFVLQIAVSIEEAAKALIRGQLAKCSTSGFLTGLGGLITLPVAIPVRKRFSTLALTAGISRDMAEYLKSIFLTCAGYENTLWDELYS